MLRKDYLLRQIEMLSALVAQLLQLRKTGQEQQAAETIQQSYRELFGLEPGLISLLPDELLLDKLRSGEYLDADKSFALAILMREDASNLATQGQMEVSVQRMLKSLKVFLATNKERALTPEQLELYDVDRMLAQLEDQTIPDDLAYDLFQYYEDTGQYAKAEDVLFDLVESSAASAAIQSEGIAFYEWLLTLSDDELIAGNLPRAEVIESLARLRALGSGTQT